MIVYLIDELHRINLLKGTEQYNIEFAGWYKTLKDYMLNNEGAVTELINYSIEHPEYTDETEKIFLMVDQIFDIVF